MYNLKYTLHTLYNLADIVSFSKQIQNRVHAKFPRQVDSNLRSVSDSYKWDWSNPAEVQNGYEIGPVFQNTYLGTLLPSVTSRPRITLAM